MEPPRIKPTRLADYLDALSKPVFQAGISWKVVDAKWPSIREAFHDFDPEWVAGLSPRDIDRLAADPRVIRNRRKIEGTIANARTMLDLDGAHRGFRRYLRSFRTTKPCPASFGANFTSSVTTAPTTSLGR